MAVEEKAGMKGPGRFGDEQVARIVIDFYAHRYPLVDAAERPAVATVLGNLAPLAHTRPPSDQWPDGAPPTTSNLRALSNMVVTQLRLARDTQVRGGLLAAFWYTSVEDASSHFVREPAPDARIEDELGVTRDQLYTETLFRVLELEPGPSPAVDFAVGHQHVSSWKRYAEVAAAADWNLLTLLLHSAWFRTRAHGLCAEEWAALVDALVRRRISLKSAGYECFPEWRATFAAALPGLNLLADDGFGADWNYFVRSDHRVSANGTAIQRLPAPHPFTYSPNSMFSRNSAYNPEYLRVPAAWKCRTCTQHHCVCPLEFCSPVRLELFALPIAMGFKSDYSTGVRTLQHIVPGTVICHYTGRIVDDDNDWEAEDNYALQVSLGNDPLYSVSALRSGNIARYINHACLPNARISSITWRGRRLGILMALTHIAPFEEITCSYGPAYWRGLRCLCPAPIHLHEKGYRNQWLCWKQKQVGFHSGRSKPSFV